MDFKYINFNCLQFTVHCDCGRMTYQELESLYRCSCGYEVNMIQTLELKLIWHNLQCIFLSQNSFVLIMLLAIVSFNVNGLRNNLKRKTIFHFLKNKKFDFIVIQETHSSHTDEKLWKCEWRGMYFVLIIIIILIYGAVILVKKSLKCVRTAAYLDQAGSLLFIEIKLDDKVFVIGNVYAPTKVESTFFGAFFQHDLVFLAGDWNLVLDNKLDKKGDPLHSNQLSKEKIKSYPNVIDLWDVFRELNLFKKCFTRY